MNLRVLAAYFVLLCSPAAWAQDPPQPFTGKVVAIGDGDDITVLHDNTGRNGGGTFATPL